MLYKDIFYSTEGLSLDEKRAILLEGKELCYEWWVDKLDCSISWARQRIDMEFDKIMEKLNTECHYTIIYRRGEKYTPDMHEMWKWKLEIAFSTMSAISYYLWLYLDEKYVSHFIEKYSLKPLL